jgi:hypothetical protein
VTLIELPDLIQGSEEWLAQRRGMVTASVVGKLVTAKTIKPASNDDSRALIALLVAERITGLVDPVWVNDDMLRGQMEEPRARDKYAEHYGVGVRTTGFMVREEDGWRLGYSPDGLVGDDGLIEVKAPRAKTHLRTILADEVPAYHMPQCQAGLLVTGREWLDFISFCGGMPMFTKRVLPDQRWFDAIQAAVEQFETTAAEMVAAYEAATEGLPMTERVDFDPDIQVAA